MINKFKYLSTCETP